MTKPSTLFLRGVPKELKVKFKSLCALRNDSMTDVMIALMQFYVEKPEQVLVLNSRERREQKNTRIYK